MKIEFQFACDQGAVRSNNEDAIKFGSIEPSENIDNKITWMIIADGMGGHQAGEVASQIIIDEVEAAIESLSISANPKNSDTSSSNISNTDWLCWIEITLNKANHKIFQQAKNNQQQKGMGSTAVLVIIINEQCYIGWVGDSRCYWYSKKNEQLKQLTTDHTMVQMLLNKGAITAKEAETANNKNMLSKAMGVKLGVEIETKQQAIHNNDLILLSTDGLHDSLTHQSLEGFVKRMSGGENISESIVKQAIINGSKDNITFGSTHIR